MNPQSGVNLGSAYADITIGNNIDSALDSATRSFDNALSRIGNSISQVGATMTSVGGTITLALAPLAGIFGKGIQQASSYEDALKEIQARAGLTAEELAMVSEKALQLGADTSFSAQQASDAFLQLLTSGSSLEEAMVQIEAVMAGAAANGAELGYTADALTDVMAAFGLEAEHSAEVMQALTAAAGSSSATFQDLVDGFANIGPVAKNMGLSVEETAAALAVFSENGIKGAEAGTQLRTMLTNMTRTTDDVTGMWNRLGVELYDAQGNMRDLDDIIKDLNVAMEGMSDQERNDVIVTLAGSYGQVGLSALLAADGIDEMTTSMEGQTSFFEIAKKRMDTFSGAVDALMGSLETLSIRVMTPFMEQVLTPTIKEITKIINLFGEWAAANEPLVTILMQVLSVLLLLGPALMGIGFILQIVGTSVSALAATFGFLLSPIGLVITAIGALVYLFKDQLYAAIQAAITGFDIFNSMLAYSGDYVQAVAAGIAYAIGQVAIALGVPAEAAYQLRSDIYNAFISIRNTIRDFLAPIGQFVSTAFAKIRDGFKMFFHYINQGSSVIDAFETTLGNLFGTNPEFVKFYESAKLIFTQLSKTVTTTFKRITAVVGPAFRQIHIFVGNTVERIQKFIQNLFKMGGSAEQAVNPIVGFFLDLGRSIMSVFQRILDGIEVFFLYINNGSDFLEAFSKALQAVFGVEIAKQIERFAYGVVDAITMAIDWVWNVAVPSFMSFVTSLVAIFWTIWNGLQPIFAWIVENIDLADLFISIGIALAAINAPVLAAIAAFAALVVAVSWLRDRWDENWNGIRDKTFAVITTIEQLGILIPYWLNQAGVAAQQLWTLIQVGFAILMVKFLEFMLWLGQQLTTAWTTLTQLGSLLVSALTTAWTTVTMFVSLIWMGLQALVTWLGDVWKTAWDAIVAFFTGLWAAVSSGFESFKTGIQDAFKWIDENVLKPAKEAWDGLVEFFTGLWDSVSGGIEALKSGLDTAFDWIMTNVVEPVTTAFQALADLINGIPQAATEAGNAAGTALANNSGFALAGPLGGFLGNMFGGSQDSGGPGYPGMAYMIGTGAQPEMFIPNSPGTFIPNADKLGGINVAVHIGSMSGMSADQARQYGEELGDAIIRKMQNSGIEGAL